MWTQESLNPIYSEEGDQRGSNGCHPGLQKERTMKRRLPRPFRGTRNQPPKRSMKYLPGVPCTLQNYTGLGTVMKCAAAARGEAEVSTCRILITRWVLTVCPLQLLATWGEGEIAHAFLSATLHAKWGRWWVSEQWVSFSHSYIESCMKNSSVWSQEVSPQHTMMKNTQTFRSTVRLAPLFGSHLKSQCAMVPTRISP